MPDMYKKYQEEVVPALVKQRGYKNIMQVPKLEKIILSCGIKTSAERDAFQETRNHLAQITGQMPVTTKSKKDVANFKLRKGTPVGVMVTLRKSRMYEFLDRYVHNTLPRVRDFRGIPKKGFDGVGNYNVGMPDLSVFLEVDPDRMKYPLGCNITFVTTAGSDDEARELLKLLEMPFAE